MPTRRKVIIDQDTLGPATSNLQSVALLLQAPEVDVLGIGVVTGDHWRDQQVRHVLRLLEIMDRREIPVLPGAVMPLVNTPVDVALWEKQFGKLVYNGAWDLARPGKWADAFHTVDLLEGNPTLPPSDEHAAVFIVRQARAFPGEISLWTAGPLTNIALACRLEPRLPSLIKELHFMGGSFNPPGDSREFKHSPRREFNLRFDPEATRIVLRSPWRKITCSPIDVSQATRSTPAHFAEIARAGTPLGHYLDQFGARNRPLWDEVSAATWLDESLVTRSEQWYLDIDLSPGPGRGNTLSWEEGFQPGLGEQKVTVQRALDETRFYETFVSHLGRR